MKILAFDTSGKACSVALCYGKKEKVLHQIVPMQQASLILPMISDLLAEFSLRVNQLDAIAYGCGPGSFTGIRIASCVAQALSFANQLPIIRVSSLLTMAESAYLELGWEKLLIAVDAKCGEVYWSICEYNQEGSLIQVLPETLCQPASIARPLGVDWNGIGDGWGAYLPQLTMRLGFGPNNIDQSHLPNAKALLHLAKIKYDKGEFTPLTEALPDYFR